MNIVLYGFAEETALRLAGRHGFTLCRTLDRLHDGHCLIASPGFPDDAARRTFLDRMLRDADRIDAVVAAVTGEDFGAVRYWAPSMPPTRRIPTRNWSASSGASWACSAPTKGSDPASSRSAARHTAGRHPHRRPPVSHSGLRNCRKKGIFAPYGPAVPATVRRQDPPRDGPPHRTRHPCGRTRRA